MDWQQQSVPSESAMYKLACVLLPDPPRFLHLTSLSKASRKAAPWVATLLVQSAVVLVPGLLWLTAGTTSRPFAHSKASHETWVQMMCREEKRFDSWHPRHLAPLTEPTFSSSASVLVPSASIRSNSIS